MAEKQCREPLTVTVFNDVLSSLRSWDALNVLGRESQYYNALADKGLRINFITYGGPRRTGIRLSHAARAPY